MAGMTNDHLARQDTPSFTSVLIPVDGSDRSERAITYAAQFGFARMVLLRVLDVKAPYENQIPGGTYGLWRQEQINSAVAYLDALAHRHAAAAASVDTRIRYGDAAAVIMAESQDYSLIAMTSHGRGMVGRMLFGSVTDRVVRNGSVPTLVVRDRGEGSEGISCNRLVVPLDGSELAEHALPAARALAGMLRVPLHLVRAVSMENVLGTERARQRATGTNIPEPPEGDAYHEAREATERAAAEYLETIATALGNAGFTVSTEVRGGTAVFELLQVVTGGDIVVMTSRGQGGYQRWMIGSVAEKLVREADGPVLLVPLRRPEDSASPQ